MSAKGSHPFILPSHVSIPLIDEFDKRLETAPRITLETHYTNPSNASLVDNSGLRFFLVPPREFAGDTFMGGSVMRHGLEPGKHLVERFGLCRVPTQAGRIHVFGYMRHAHRRGRQLYSFGARPVSGAKATYTRLYNMSTPDAPFDYNLQTVQMLPKEHVYEPNDVIVTQCNYDTSKDTERVRFGVSTDDEMCLMYTYYYPRVSTMAWHLCMELMGSGEALSTLTSRGVRFE